MKKFSLTTIPLFCAAAMPLCADNANAGTTTKQQKQQMEMNAITPSAEPAVPNCCSPFITADFIWWKAQEEGLVYAKSGFAASGAPSKGSFYTPDFQFQPGFKVGFGLKFRHDGWDLYARYTWLNSNSNSSSTPTTTASSQVSSNLTEAVLHCASASANWKLKFNNVDLELGRNYWISKWLTLRPHVGLKCSGVFQKMYANYTATSYLSTSAAFTNVALKNNEFGLGIRTGLDANFYMNKYFSVYGDFAISALWNRFHTFRADSSFTFAGAQIDSYNIKKTVFDVTEVLELALGLSFEYPFHNDEYMWYLQAGWEEQIWFNQNQFPLLINANQANLSFEGVTVETGFYF